jgi:hypothetical protein
MIIHVPFVNMFIDILYYAYFLFMLKHFLVCGKNWIIKYKYQFHIK